MVKFLAKMLEKFTIDIAPKFPIRFRTPLYASVLRIRKVRDNLRIKSTSKNPTFQERLDYALDSRNSLNRTGSQLSKFQKDVEVEKIENLNIPIYKFIPDEVDEDKFGIYFHGGGYFAGSYTSHKNLVSKLTSNSKMVIYFFEYRLSPEFNFPSAHEDAQAVVEYLHNIENKKTSIWMGESAGGGLATGLIIDKKFKISPDKLVLMSPWLDLSNKSEDRKFLKNKDITIILNGMHDVGEFYAGEYGSNNPIISPVYADIDNFPETLIQVSSSELLFNDALEFVKKLKDKNIKVDLQIWNKLWHAWHFFPIKESEEAIDKIIKFIKQPQFQSSK